MQQSGGEKNLPKPKTHKPQKKTPKQTKKSQTPFDLECRLSVQKLPISELLILTAVLRKFLWCKTTSLTL